jgi:hypothetical protein
VIRRCLLILLGLLAFGTVLPSAPVVAAPMSHHDHGPMAAHAHGDANSIAMLPGHCDGGHGGLHMCMGCAVDPAQPSAVEPAIVPPSPAPIASLAAISADHRPDFDPPPPRAIG